MPWLIPAAIVAAAGIGVAGSAIASGNAAKSSQSATDATIAENNAALAQQQSNSAPYRAAGGLALNALTDRFGLTNPTPSGAPGTSGAAAGGAPHPYDPTGGAGGQPDWNAYLAADPGIAQQYAAQAPSHLAAMGVNSLQDFAAWHWNNVGQSEQGRLNPYTGVRVGEAAPAAAPVETAAATPDPANPSAPSPAAPTTGAAAIDNQGFYTAPRPTVAAAPVYQAPTLRETPVAPLDVSIGKYQQSPDYNFQLEQGDRNVLAKASATGGLESGAALKALQTFGQNLALGDYSQWRNYATGQYNNDRSFTANRDDAANGFNLTNAGRNFDSANSTYQFGTNLGQSIYNSDRDYTSGQYNTNTNALFNLASMGSGQSTNYNNALATNAAANSSAYFSNANNQGNAALATGGAINGAAGNAGNALAYYYGNKPTSTGDSSLTGLY